MVSRATTMRNSKDSTSSAFYFTESDVSLTRILAMNRNCEEGKHSKAASRDQWVKYSAANEVSTKCTDNEIDELFQ